MLWMLSVSLIKHTESANSQYVLVVIEFSNRERSHYTLATLHSQIFHCNTGALWQLHANANPIYGLVGSRRW
jgi:hypothetical protein